MTNRVMRVVSGPIRCTRVAPPRLRLEYKEERLTGRRSTLRQCRQVAAAYEAEERIVLLLMGYAWSSNYKGVCLDLLLPKHFMFIRDH